MTFALGIKLIWLAWIAASLLELEAKNTGKQEESARKVIKQCQISARFRTLAEFLEFYEHFKQIDECLHSIKEPSKLCQEAETICERVNIYYQDVRVLGALIKRYKSSESVCTIEYSSKIYRLHKQLEQIGSQEGDQPLSGPLRILANRVASGCRKSLAKRLLEVERRTTAHRSPVSESLKHLNAILSCLNVGFERLEQIEIEPEQVNPIFTDELAQASRTLSLARDGFELQLNEAMQTYLDSIKASCSSLHSYQMNLLGSLGTLASVGYGISPATKAHLQESRVDKIRIHTWSLAAVLCQSVRGVLKMSRVKVDGKMFRKVKVLVSQEADVSPEDELDDVFASYRLAEEKADRDLTASDSARDEFRFDAKQINRRKKQLLQGPNYRLVRAIIAYINPMQMEERFKIPYEMLALEVPEGKFKDDHEEEEEEEEEDEED